MNQSLFMVILTVFSLIACRTQKVYVGKTSLSGVYISVDSKFERLSSLTLQRDSSFVYKYLLGGCQDKITGKWTVVQNEVNLKTNINKDTVQYHMPDLNNIRWSVTKAGLKPDRIIDNGCFQTTSLHKKQQTATNTILAKKRH